METTQRRGSMSGQSHGLRPPMSKGGSSTQNTLLLAMSFTLTLLILLGVVYMFVESDSATTIESETRETYDLNYGDALATCSRAEHQCQTELEVCYSRVRTSFNDQKMVEEEIREERKVFEEYRMSHAEETDVDGALLERDRAREHLRVCEISRDSHKERANELIAEMEANVAELNSVQADFNALKVEITDTVNGHTETNTRLQTDLDKCMALADRLRKQMQDLFEDTDQSL